MKRYFLAFAVMCLAWTSAMAEDELPQGFGIQLGWAQPIIRLNSPDASIPKDSLVNTVRLNGFKVGVVYDATFIAGFGSSMGINYTFGAAHTDWAKKANDLSHSERNIYQYHQLELFVDWQYKFEVAKETYLILYTGPTIQYGILFKNRYEVRDDWFEDVTTTDFNRFEKHEEAASDKDLNALNVTWGVGAGFQYQRYYLRGGYDFGIINPYRNKQFVSSSDDRYTRGRFDQWNIRLGIYLWQKK